MDLSGSSSAIERVKEKQLVVSANVSSHDLEVAAGRIRKWLAKGLFVRVTVAKGKGGDRKAAEEVEEKLKERAGGEQEHATLLVFKIV